MKKKKNNILRAVGYLVFVFILLYLLNIYLSNNKNQNWIKESKPFAENFLELLKEKKIELLYQKFASNGTIEIDKFQIRLNDFYSKFGNITSYKFKNGYPTYQGSSLNGLYIAYIISVKDMEYQCIFSVLFDHKNHAPSIGDFVKVVISPEDPTNKRKTFIINLHSETLEAACVSHEPDPSCECGTAG